MTSVTAVVWRDGPDATSPLCMELFSTYALARAWRETHHPIDGWLLDMPVRGADF